MVNLLTLLSDRLDLRLRGRQFVGGWQALDAAESPPLGQAVLGSQAVLGRKAWDAAAGIEITVNAAPLNRLLSLLPGGEDHALMSWLLRRHTQAELQVSLILQPEPQRAEDLPRLGQARLGWDQMAQPQHQCDGDLPETHSHPNDTRHPCWLSDKAKRIRWK